MTAQERKWYEKQVASIHRARHGLVTGEMVFSGFFIGLLFPGVILAAALEHHPVTLAFALSPLVLIWTTALRAGVRNGSARSLVDDLRKRPDLRDHYRETCAPEKVAREREEEERKRDAKRLKEINEIVNTPHPRNYGKITHY